MSLFHERYKCNNCKYEFNASTGTNGMGLPNRCPNCNFLSYAFVVKIADDWLMDDGRWMQEHYEDYRRKNP